MPSRPWCAVLLGEPCGVGCPFGEDCVGDFTERLDAGPSRRALGRMVRRAKRNKAFDDRRFIGLGVDGTGTARLGQARCPLCRPRYGTDQQVVGYGHDLSAIAVVGTGVVLPLDVEPDGPGDSELAASQRLLRRAVEGLGPRFAQ